MRGLLITFEGTEGTGKTTQAQLLAAALQAAGRAVLLTREPGGTPFGVRLRNILLEPAGRPLAPYAELFLYLADRAQHIREVIAPSLDQGICVLCDRFTDATVAYQGYGRGLDPDLIRESNKRASGGISPALTVLLEFDRVEDGLARARGRQAADGTAGVEDRFEQEDVEFHRRVHQGYRNLATAEPERFMVLPAGLPPGDLEVRIAAAVRTRIEARIPGTGA